MSFAVFLVTVILGSFSVFSVIAADKINTIPDFWLLAGGVVSLLASLFLCNGSGSHLLCIEKR